MRILFASLLLASVAMADDTARGDLKGDVAKVQGHWTTKIGPEKNIPLSLEIKGQTAEIIFKRENEVHTLKGEFRLDESKSPKQWNWTKFQNAQGQDVPENLAIYKIEGDSLTICAGGPGNDRPSAFEAGPNGEPTLVVFTREKADPRKEGDAKKDKGEK